MPYLKKPKQKGLGGVAQEVKCLSSKNKAVSAMPNTTTNNNRTFKEPQNIFPKIFIKRKTLTLQWGNLADTTTIK